MKRVLMSFVVALTLLAVTKQPDWASESDARNAPAIRRGSGRPMKLNGAAANEVFKLNVPYRFIVTGESRGELWGTDFYADASSPGKAAVHAGVLDIGETAAVRVTFLRHRPSAGTYQHGIISRPADESFERCFQIEGFGDAPRKPRFYGRRMKLNGGTGREVFKQHVPYRCIVTGESRGDLFGSGYYSDASSPGKAAVHAGVLKIGQTAAVKVTFLPNRKSGASYQHGIISRPNDGSSGRCFTIELSIEE